MVNNHFANDSLFSVSADQGFVDGALSCLDTFVLLQGPWSMLIKLIIGLLDWIPLLSGFS